jgi:hypothetical protein
MENNMKDPVPPLDKDHATLLEDAEEGKNGEGMRKRLNNKESFLSFTSKKYDVDGDGKLDEAEQKLRDMDIDNRGYLTNEKVYQIMLEQMKLQKEVFSLKRLSLVFVVIMFFLSLATLATSFAAATLAKDTKIKDDNLVGIDGSNVIGTKNAGMTVAVSEGAASNGRRLNIVGSTISRDDAAAAYDTCAGGYVELERTCAGDKVVEVPICPAATRQRATPAVGAIDYTYTLSYGDVTVECPSITTDPCVVTFPAATPTCAQLSPASVNLGGAGSYVILTKTGITTTGTTAITGDIAVSPIAASSMTGFGLVKEANTGYATSSTVVGKVFAPDTNYVGAAAILTPAVGDMGTAYTDAAGRPTTGARSNLGSTGGLGGPNGDLPGGPNDPFTTGVYTYTINVLLKGDLHFRGTSDDIFIIQTSGNVIQSGGFKVILDATSEGTPQAKNIFWQVAGSVTVEAGAHMKGILLVKNGVDFLSEASLEGRVLAQTACTLIQNTIYTPGDWVEPNE